MTHTPNQMSDDCREAFEFWAKTQGLPLRHGIQHYCDRDTLTKWYVWKAAWNTRAAALPIKTPCMEEELDIPLCLRKLPSECPMCKGRGRFGNGSEFVPFIDCQNCNATGKIGPVSVPSDKERALHYFNHSFGGYKKSHTGEVAEYIFTREEEETIRRSITVSDQSEVIDKLVEALEGVKKNYVAMKDELKRRSRNPNVAWVDHMYPEDFIDEAITLAEKAIGR